MLSTNNIHRNEKGQTALETAIILIAFIVVASVFAFTILSAGSASTEKGEAAIYSGLEGVQSSMNVKGAVIAQAGGATVDTVKFTLSLVSGGDPVDLNTTNKVVVIGYRDAAQFENNIDWTVNWVVHNDGAAADDMLEEGELAEIEVDLTGLATTLAKNTEFTLEVKPPTGAVLSLTRTTPASIEKVMELR
ncbi:MAG: hypothetical protein HZC41_26025 [Chloroflexi bacterium]|nr:hypothetical protein [Chloroflexota bacterium]